MVEDLRSVADHLLRRTVWIVGGDGWAYDIGSGGLDHVLASGRNVNVLVLDTEVYSNTGGQSSKSTPIGAVAKFAAAGKASAKKDLALQAIAYGNVYVARVAMGADPHQTLTAFREAEAYDGPVARHRLQPLHRPRHRDAARGSTSSTAPSPPGTGRWCATTRRCAASGGNPFQLDSPRPRIPLEDYIYNELRYRMLRNADPAEAERLLGARPGGRRPAVADLRGDGHPRRRPVRRRPEEDPVTDLTTSYLGLALRNPLVASASPLSQGVDRVRALAGSGVGAVVLYSLFEEQVHREQLRDLMITEPHEDAFGEAQTWFPSVPTTQPVGVGALPAAARAGVRGGRRAGDRQPQRQQPRRLGELRPVDAGCRRRGHRAQHLPGARRTRTPAGATSRTGTSRSCARSRPRCRCRSP